MYGIRLLSCYVFYHSHYGIGYLEIGNSQIPIHTKSKMEAEKSQPFTRPDMSRVKSRRLSTVIKSFAAESGVENLVGISMRGASMKEEVIDLRVKLRDLGMSNVIDKICGLSLQEEIKQLKSALASKDMGLKGVSEDEEDQKEDEDTFEVISTNLMPLSTSKYDSTQPSSAIAANQSSTSATISSSANKRPLRRLSSVIKNVAAESGVADLVGISMRGAKMKEELESLHQQLRDLGIDDSINNSRGLSLHEEIKRLKLILVNKSSDASMKVLGDVEERKSGSKEYASSQSRQVQDDQKLDDISMELESCNKKLRILQSENSTLKSKISKLQDQISINDVEKMKYHETALAMTRLEEKYGNVSGEHDTTLREMNVLERKLLFQGKEIVELQKEMSIKAAAMNDQLDEVRKYKETAKNIENINHDLRIVIIEKSKSIDAVNIEAKQAKAEVQARTNEVKVHLKRNQELENIITQKEEQINELKLAFSKQADDRLSEIITSSQREKEQLEFQLKVCMETLAQKDIDYQNYKNEVNDQIFESQNQMNHLLEDITKEKNLVSALEASNSSLAQNLSEISNEIRSVRVDMQNKDNELHSCQRRVVELDQILVENQELFNTTKLHYTKDSERRLSEMSQAFETEKEALVSKVDVLLNELEQKRIELIEMEASKAEEHATLQSRFKEILNGAEELEDKNSSLAEELRSLISLHKKKSVAYEELLCEVEVLREDIDDAETTFQIMIDKEAALQKTIQDIKENEPSKEEMAELISKLSLSELSLQKKSDNYDILHARLQEMTAALEELEEQIEVLESENQDLKAKNSEISNDTFEKDKNIVQECNNLRSKLATNEEINIRQSEELSLANKATSEYEARLKEATDMLKNHESKYKLLSDDYLQCQSDLAKKENMLNESRLAEKELIADQVKTIERLKAEMIGWQEEKKLFKEELDKASFNTEQLNKLQKRDTLAESTPLRSDEKVELEAAIKITEKKLRQAESEISQLSNALLIQSDEVKKMEAIVADYMEMKRILDEQNTFLRDAADSLDVSDQELLNLRNQLDESLAELSLYRNGSNAKSLNESVVGKSTPKVTFGAVNQSSSSGYVFTAWSEKITYLQQQILYFSEQLECELSEKKDIRRLLAQSIDLNQELITKSFVREKANTLQAADQRWQALNSVPVFMGYDFLYRIPGITVTLNSKDSQKSVSVINDALTSKNAPNSTLSPSDVEGINRLQLSNAVEHLTNGWSVIKVCYLFFHLWL